MSKIIIIKIVIPDNSANRMKLFFVGRFCKHELVKYTSNPITQLYSVERCLIDIFNSDRALAL